MEQTAERRLGDTRALEDLIAAYEKDLLRLCCLYLRDAALAEDAVQETFLKAYKAMGSFRGDCSEKTWLWRIAMNVCRDLRRGGWFRFVDRRVELETLPLPVAPPSADHVALTTAIMQLPRKYMEVVVLFYYQDMKLREIAQVLGTTPAAVSGRLTRARERLHKALEGGGNDA